jgi:hypothetical protein
LAKRPGIARPFLLWLMESGMAQSAKSSKRHPQSHSEKLDLAIGRLDRSGPIARIWAAIHRDRGAREATLTNKTRTEEAELAMGLKAVGDQWRDVRFVPRNEGARPFRAISLPSDPGIASRPEPASQVRLVEGTPLRSLAP